jgi:hypothetical protein
VPHPSNPEPVVLLERLLAEAMDGRILSLVATVVYVPDGRSQCQRTYSTPLAKSS